MILCLSVQTTQILPSNSDDSSVIVYYYVFWEHV